MSENKDDNDEDFKEGKSAIDAENDLAEEVLKNLKDGEKGKDNSIAIWIGVCLVCAVASLYYRGTVLGALEQTSLLFIGIPLFIAIACSFIPDPKSYVGVIVKTITMGMAFFGILLIEGFICILIASPLFYFIGITIGIILDIQKARAGKKRDNKLYCSLVVVLAFMSLEGVMDITSFERHEKVTIKREYDFSKQSAFVKLVEGPDFDLTDLPAFLKLGFPEPQEISGDGINEGDQWKIHFAGGEGNPGDLVVEVVHRDEDGVTFQCVKDTSHIAHWLDWKKIHWQVTELSNETCRVDLSIEFDRQLDPAWYFKPMERYGVTKAGEYFMKRVFGAPIGQ